MTEGHLAREVRRLAARYDVRAVHVPDSRTLLGHKPAGMPDWVLVGTAVMWRELKAPFSSLSGAQSGWRYALQAAGADWDIWRPVDLYSGRIEQDLQAIAPPWATPLP